MTKLKNLLYPILSLAALGGGHIALADGANFTVMPTLTGIPNQIDQNVGYFDLLLKPNQKQDLPFTLYNSAATTIKVKTTFGTAFTSSSGTVDYTPNLVKPDPSMKLNLKDYIKLPQTVSIPARTKVDVTAHLTMPATSFQGVMAGGFNFEDAGSDSPKQKTSGVTIQNRFRYVIGLVVQNTKNQVAPTLSLGTVKPDQVNGRNVISANLTDSAPAYLMNMNTQATVTKYGDKAVKYTYNNANMEMAPNSNFNLAIPVSIQGVLNGQTSKPLTPGKYHLKMTVYGGKDDKGTYQTLVNGQVTKYDYRWIFDKDFTIAGETAKKLNAKDATVSHKTTIP